MFAIFAVVVAVAIVVDAQQCVDNQSACKRNDGHFKGDSLRPRRHNDVICKADGDDAKEYKHQHIAHTVV